jgi:hypothetical protein
LIKQRAFKVKKSLKNKVLISVPVIFIAVMLIVIFVVSVILSKQNRKVADTLIQNTFNIIRYTITEGQEKLLLFDVQVHTAAGETFGEKTSETHFDKRKHIILPSQISCSKLRGKSIKNFSSLGAVGVCD